MKSFEGVVDAHAYIRETRAENTLTLILTTILVAGAALGTGSLHCLWGLVMLLNLNKLTILSIDVKDLEARK